MHSSPDFSQNLLTDLTSRVSSFSDEKSYTTLSSPIDNSEICDIVSCRVEDVDSAVRFARGAQRNWQKINIKDRCKIFLRLHDLIFKNKKQLMDLLQYETGKARKSAFEEVADCAIVSRYYAYHAPKILKDKSRRGALPIFTQTCECNRPIGVIGIIAPWNYPLTLALTDAIPALIAGNAVVLKPASNTPLTALYVHKLLEKAGIPDYLFQVINGSGKVLGTRLAETADYILFTGSTETGKYVGKIAGERLIGQSMELGGKNPLIILPDADIATTVDGCVRGCFANSGQLCISIERIYVHESIADNFKTAFEKKVNSLKLGQGYCFDYDMGCLISSEQLDTVENHVKDAVDKGAEVICGAKKRPDIGPCYYEPTVLTNVDERMTLFKEETFGPVVSIYTYNNIREVTEKANNTEYGLNASIWSTDINQAKRVAAKIKAGTVNINEAYAATWASVDAPMGGFKQSGVGRRHGRQGIMKFTEAQTISVQRGIPIGAFGGMTEKTFSDIMTIALKALKHIPGLR